MKTLLIYFFLSMSFFVYSQDEILPDNIESAFMEKYPDTRIDNWKYENAIYYLEYYKRGSMYTAAFNDNGQWIETSETISDFDIPVLLSEYLKKNYPSGKILFTESIVNTSPVRYVRVNLNNENKLIVIKLDSNGKNIVVEKTEEYVQ
ncbi:MAG: PepSY-like domain-containing protein [Bacteroidales bacterium]|nr:PepSY-like domain-containing protein [Bacteroidales bacterium]